MDDKVSEAKAVRQRSSLYLVACARGLLPDCKQLLEAGALPGTTDKEGLGAAHFSAAHGKTDMLTYLWSKGLELDSEDPKGRTPLHLAALGGHADSVRWLLEKGSWPDAFDEADNSALHLAARVGHVETIEQLLGGGAKLEVRNKRGVTPLGEAIVAGHLQAAKALHRGGGCREDRSRGLTLLHLSAGTGRPAVMEWLLRGGASLSDDGNPQKVTPLHCAAISGSLDAVRLLLEHGADAQAATTAGRLAADLVPSDCPSYEAVAAVLTRAGGRPSPATASLPASSSRPEAPTPHLPHTPAQEFLNMSSKDRLRRARRWAEDPDAPAAKVALDGLPPEASKHIRAAASVGRALTIHKALAAVHSDGDFQQDLLRLPLEKIVEDVKAHPSNYAKHVTNPDVDRAMGVIRAFHSVVKANGGSAVSLPKLSAGEPLACQERDRMLTQRITTKYTAHLQAACAAADATGLATGVSPETAARLAFEEAVKLPERADDRPGAVTSSFSSHESGVHQRKSAAGGPPSTSPPSQSSSLPPRHTAAETDHPSRHNIAVHDGPFNAVSQSEDEAPTSTWQETLAAECKRLLLQSVVMVITAAFIAWILRLGPFADLSRPAGLLVSKEADSGNSVG